MTKDIY